MRCCRTIHCCACLLHIALCQSPVPIGGEASYLRESLLVTWADTQPSADVFEAWGINFVLWRYQAHVVHTQTGGGVVGGRDEEETLSVQQSGALRSYKLTRSETCHESCA